MTYDPLKQYASITESPSFFKRAIAVLLDISILSMTILAPITGLLETITPAEDFKTTYALFVENQQMSSIITVSILFVSALIMMYFLIVEYVVGQTAGQRLMGLKVMSIHGEQPTFFQCFLRNLIVFPVFPFILFWMLDPLYLLFTKKTLTEQLTKTKVVRT
jgi:uncharacterized RDD family membrane protein YckC